MAVAPLGLVQRWTGLSTDTKPTTGVPASSLFYEMDSGVTYSYSGTAWQILSAPAYYDRVAVTQYLRRDIDGVAPHVLTVWVSRTVPSGRLAMVDGAYTRIIRATAADSIGTSARGFSVITRSGASYPIGGADLGSNVNAIGVAVAQSVGCWGVAIAGDILQVETRDDNTGGTCNYALFLKATEFVGSAT